MAAAVLTVAALTVPAVGVTPDMTALTGGQSYVNGFNGSDFALSTNANSNTRKKLGNSQITAVPFTTTGNPAPGSGNGTPFRTFALDGRDLLGYTGSNSTPIPVTLNAALKWVCGAGTLGIGTGIDYTIAADQNLKHFVWMGGLACGDYSITASFADSSMVAQSITLNGPNIYNADERWFEVYFRSILPTTLRIRIMRTSQLSGGFGDIVIPAVYLEKNVAAPQPRTYKSFIAAQGAFGGFSS